MNRHPIDTLSAALGAVTVGAGVLVMTDALDRIDNDSGWWFAVGALVVGLGLIPWNRRQQAEPVEPVEEAGDAGAEAEDVVAPRQP